MALHRVALRQQLFCKRLELLNLSLQTPKAKAERYAPSERPKLVSVLWCVPLHTPRKPKMAVTQIS